MPGGDLLIEWRESDDHILMTGPYALDYEGTLPPELLAAGAFDLPVKRVKGRSTQAFVLEAAKCRISRSSPSAAGSTPMSRRSCASMPRTPGSSDAVIVNTCAVTQEAVRQARQAIRKARRARPDAKIVVTGCAAQIDPARFAAMAEVDHVIGNQEKTEARPFTRSGVEDTERVKVNDIMSVTETAGHLIEGFGTQARAYVQIQNGCDHRCTFCIIPFGRGPSRSVPAGEVVAQVRKLVENGYAEIVLTGVDITAYGADLPGEMTLGKLVREGAEARAGAAAAQALLDRFGRGRCRRCSAPSPRRSG